MLAHRAGAGRGYHGPVVRAETEEDRRLAEWLVASGIAGPHRSHPEEDNVHKAALLTTGDPDATFGIRAAAGTTAAEALQAVAGVAGCREPGEAYIDPAATLAGAADAARRLAAACRAGARVLVATGHPTGLLPLCMRVAESLAARGAKLRRPLEDRRLAPGDHRRLRYLGGVAVLTDGASLLHTHSPWAMERVLASGEKVDLVLGDHGFAGAAVEAGIPAVAFMDTNDPALAVAKALGAEVVLVPLDDNRPPDLYLPLAERMVADLG